ncbi:hypothetical protein K8R42_05515 [bacterium]|nr:hypothetical protein [bacterium]
MIKINWHKVASREFSFLWGSYTASVYKIMKKMTGTEVRNNLYFTQGRTFTVYREKKDVERSYKLINDLAKKNPKKILGYMDKLEELIAENYNLFKKIKQAKTKVEIKKHLIKLDKVFLYTAMYYLYLVFLGYGGHLPASKQLLKKYNEKFKKLRMSTIDVDMHREFPKLFGKFDARLKKYTLYMTRQELVRVLKGQKVNWAKIKTRHKETLMVTKNNITGEYPANKIKDALEFELSHLRIDKNTKIIKGSIACKGRVKGKVVKIFKPSDYKEIKTGNIVVTTMTKPDIIPYLKEVKGIITDDGGTLSHALIISREMKIPCVVGTSYGTEILKNGEEIILDASKGIIKRKK